MMAVRKSEGMRRSLPDRYLAPKELADVLGVPVQTLYLWRCKGEGPRGFRVGRHVRYDPDEVLAWIDRQTVEGVV